MDKHNKPICRSLDKLSYLKEVDRIQHYANTPSLASIATRAGAALLSAGFFVGGSVVGGVASAVIGHQVANKNEQSHRQKVIKTTYVLQIAFNDNTSAVIEVDEKEYRQFAKHFERFALI